MNKFDMGIFVAPQCNYAESGWYFPRRIPEDTKLICFFSGREVSPYKFYRFGDN